MAANLLPADIKYSYERILSPTLKSPNSWFLENIEGATEYLQWAC